MRLIAILLSAATTLGALTPEQLNQLPPPAASPVSFSAHIKPIFEASCIKCHGRGKAKGGFAIDNRETFLKGGDSGPAIQLGKSLDSLLIHMVSGLDPEIIMPEKGSKLTAEQVGLLRAWIDRGAQWEDGINFGRQEPLNLHPRKPELKEASEVNHPIDRLLHGYLKTNALKNSAVVSDRIFARRAYLDIIGLIPKPSELDRFTSETNPEKRRELVLALLGRNDDYAQHWLSFWNDALRNDYKGTGYIDGGRKQITGWLYESLASNKPYDQFVRELINPKPESEGFTKGIIWRGVVNASQTPQMQAAQNISQVFMGVNLKCASCHDSFINDWTLADAYGLASIYADEQLEMFKCDVPTGKKAGMKFIFPELGAIDPALDKPARLKHLSEVVTSQQNGRLSRTIVNRIWARLLGRGLVEPVDEMDQPAWHTDLLDYLAADLVDNKYDLKRTIELIMTSQAYQLPAIPVREQTGGSYVFQGPAVRRLSAEQFLDVIGEVTGVWSENPQFNPGSDKVDAKLANLPAKAKWIWSTANAATAADPGTIYVRKNFNLDQVPSEAHLVITCDNDFKLFVNGQEAGSSRDFAKPELVDIRNHLRVGRNLIAVEANNWAGGSPANPVNPAGLIAYARVRLTAETKAAKPIVLDFATDSTWLVSPAKIEGWEKLETTVANWPSAVEVGEPHIGPWSLGAALASRLSAAAGIATIRSALVAADPLTTAMGRPNREQVMTTRASTATTLQALELTNGSTLANKLRVAAEKLARTESSPADFITDLYQRALNRLPTGPELDAGMELVGDKIEVAEAEDFLWAMVMLPEFQLIH